MNLLVKKLRALPFLLLLNCLPKVLCMEVEIQGQQGPSLLTQKDYFWLYQEIELPDSLSIPTMDKDNRSIIISSYSDKTLRIFDKEERKYIQNLPFKGEAHFVEFSSNGCRILISTKDKKTYIWNALTNSSLFLNGYIAPFIVKAFNYDSTKILTALSFSHLCLSSTDTGLPLKLLPELPSTVSSALFSPEGSTLLIQLDNQIIYIADSNEGVFLKKVDTVNPFSSSCCNSLHNLPKHEVTLLSSTFNKQGVAIAFYMINLSTIILYDSETSEKILSINVQTPFNDEALIVVPYSNRFLFRERKESPFLVFSTFLRKKISTLQGCREVPSAVEFNDDETILLTSFTSKRETDVWDCQTGKLITTLKGCLPGSNYKSFNKNITNVLTKFGPLLYLWQKNKK